MHIGGAMQRLFILSLNGCPFPIHLSASLKCGLTVGHTCSMNETEWGKTIGTRGGSNGAQYE